jgi:hypothetical protein
MGSQHFKGIKMNDVQQALCIALLKRIVYGTALDDVGNRDDDSLREVIGRSNEPATIARLNDIDVNARRLLALVETK